MSVSNPSKGFTLIELMVVAAIVVVISSIILADNNRFGGVVQLENLAYDMGLSIRQAQVYGISVQRFGTDNFSAAYGVHFALSDNKEYELFADVSSPPDGVFEANEGELVPGQPTMIAGGDYITQLCVTPSNGTEECSDSNGDGPQSLDILFIRPEPDACISYNGETSTTVSNGQEQCISTNQSARIVVESPRGDMMSIEVDSNGQISVHNQ